MLMNGKKAWMLYVLNATHRHIPDLFPAKPTQHFQDGGEDSGAVF